MVLAMRSGDQFIISGVIWNRSIYRPMKNPLVPMKLDYWQACQSFRVLHLVDQHSV